MAGVPAAEFRRLLLTKIAPLGFVLGAGMEAFMYATGFWGVATKKEAERRAEKRRLLASLHRHGGHLASEGVAASPLAGTGADGGPKLG